MKKDIEWLKKEIEEYLEYEGVRDARIALESVLGYIDQLDEPEVKQLDKKIRELEYYNDELIRDNNQLRNAMDNQEVLSQEWIDEHKYFAEEKIGEDAVVKARDLRNLLVPKQDKQEKPVIPQFVAEWFENDKRDMEIEDVFWQIENCEMVKLDVDRWISDNRNTFIRAWIDGFTVEKEKLYRVCAGNRYVRFNLNGSIIGVKKDNSIVCLERLSKLPFDYKKAVESGIITLEEVTPCN